MNTTMRAFLAVAVAAACLACEGPALGQDALMRLLDPRLGQAKTKARYGTVGHPSQSVRHQAAELGFTQYDLEVTTPLSQDERREWMLSGRFKGLDIDTGARFPGSGEAFPEDLWDIRLEASHRRQFDNGWLAGLAAEIGSASDRPFAGPGETTFESTGFVRIPADGNDAWLMMLHFRTELDALRGAPLLPGVGYHWVKDEKFQAVIGAPYAWAQYKPIEKLKLSGLVGLTDINAKAAYELIDDVSLYTKYDWGSQRFVRHDRPHTNERLFYYGQRVSAGVRWTFGEHLWIDAGGGYEFERFFFEGKSYHNRHDRRFRIGDAPFAALRLGLDF